MVRKRFVEIEESLPTEVSERLAEMLGCSDDLRRDVIQRAVQQIPSDDACGRAAVAGILIRAVLEHQLERKPGLALSELRIQQINDIATRKLPLVGAGRKTLALTGKTIERLLAEPWTLGIVMIKMWNVKVQPGEKLKHVAEKGRLGGSTLRRDAIKIMVGTYLIPVKSE
jgi:hypothetical protein